MVDTITVENDIMSTFILLLIHDIRHDFNYNIWSPTLISFMNTNEDLKRLKEMLRGGNGEVATMHMQSIHNKSLPTEHDSSIFFQYQEMYNILFHSIFIGLNE